MKETPEKFKHHEEYAEIAQILVSLNYALLKKETAFRKRAEIVDLNKRVVNRVKKLLDDIFQTYYLKGEKHE